MNQDLQGYHSLKHQLYKFWIIFLITLSFPPLAETSYASYVVAVGESAPSVPDNLTLTVSPQPSPPPPSSSQLPRTKKFRYGNERQLRRQDHEPYDVPQELTCTSVDKTMHKRYLERRQHLLDLQIQHMQIRLEEAEERREEARIWRKIAEQEMEKVTNK